MPKKGGFDRKREVMPEKNIGREGGGGGGG